MTQLKERGFYSPTRHTDAYLCRFLRARKWDFEAAKGMLLESEEWRRDFKVDELYEHFSFPEKEEVNKLYPQFYHKTDKDGRPVYIEQLGNLDLNKLFKVTTPERLIQQLVYEYEKCINERMPVCSELYNKLIETSCTIMDLKNVGIGQFWKVSSYVQQASKIGQYYYPETMGRFYIINAPYIFTTVWSVVKAWLDPVTREKIQILGSNYMGELSKQIPLENIPALIGGKSLAENPSECMMSDAGPWNTPEGKEIIQRIKEEKQRIKQEYAETGQVTQNDTSKSDDSKPSNLPQKDQDASDERKDALVGSSAAAAGAGGAAASGAAAGGAAAGGAVDGVALDQNASPAPKQERTSVTEETFTDANSDVPPHLQSSSAGLEAGVANMQLHPQGSQLTVVPGMESVSSQKLDRITAAHNDSKAAPSLSAQGSDGLAPPITSDPAL